MFTTSSQEDIRSNALDALKTNGKIGRACNCKRRRQARLVPAVCPLQRVETDRYIGRQIESRRFFDQANDNSTPEIGSRRKLNVIVTSVDYRDRYRDRLRRV